MMKFCFIFLMLFNFSAHAAEMNALAECDSRLSTDAADLEIEKRAARFLALLNFDHPIFDHAVSRATSFQALYFLVHFTGGFEFSTDANRYSPFHPKFKQKHGKRNWIPSLSYAYPSLKHWLNMDSDDDFYRYLPKLKGIHHEAVIHEQEKWVIDQNKKFISWSNEQSWRELDNKQRGNIVATFVLRMGLLFKLFAEGRNTEIYTRFDVHPPESLLSEVRGLFTEEELGRLSEAAAAVADEKVLPKILQQIDEVFPALLQRRLDFRIRLLHNHKHASADSSGPEFIAHPDRVDVISVKSWLLRGTDRKQRLRNKIRSLIGQERMDAGPSTALAHTAVEIAPNKTTTAIEVKWQIEEWAKNQQPLTTEQWENRITELTNLFAVLSVSTPASNTATVLENLRVIGQNLLTLNDEELRAANMVPLNFQLTEWESLARASNYELYTIVEAMEMIQTQLHQGLQELIQASHTEPKTRAAMMKASTLTEQVLHLQQYLTMVDQTFKGLEIRWSTNQQVLSNSASLKLIMGTLQSLRASGADMNFQIQTWREALTALFKSLDMPVPSQMNKPPAS